MIKCLCMITSNWDSRDEFEARASGEFGLDRWLLQNEQLFGDNVESIIACGTWSDPLPAYERWSETHLVDVVNAGVERSGGYDVVWRQYCLSAFMAGFHFALNLAPEDWDLLIQLDNDILIGSVDFNQVLREFISRPEILLSPAWCRWPGGPFIAWKRSGVARYVNQRRRQNVYDSNKGPEPMLAERELGEIFAGGRWWNPWPQIENVRQDWPQEASAERTNASAMSWPFVRQPHPTLIEPYRQRHLGKQVPLWDSVE